MGKRIAKSGIRRGQGAYPVSTVSLGMIKRVIGFFGSSELQFSSPAMEAKPRLIVILLFNLASLMIKTESSTAS